MDGIPSQELFMSVAIFFLFSFITIFPPQEARQLGFVIPHVFSFLMKEEKFDFITHHLQRSIVTMFVHASLPLCKFALKSFIYKLHEYLYMNLLVYTLTMYFMYFENFQVHHSFVFIKFMIRISFTVLFG